MELLVVTVIIAILASLLLPALARAKSVAQDHQCLTNLRNFGIIHQPRSVDNDGNILPISITDRTFTAGGWWWQMLWHDSYIEQPFSSGLARATSIRHAARRHPWRCSTRAGFPLSGSTSTPAARTVAAGPRPGKA